MQHQGKPLLGMKKNELPPQNWSSVILTFIPLHFTCIGINFICNSPPETSIFIIFDYLPSNWSEIDLLHVWVVEIHFCYFCRLSLSFVHDSACFLSISFALFCFWLLLCAFLYKINKIYKSYIYIISYKSCTHFGPYIGQFLSSFIYFVLFIWTVT